MDTVFLHGLEVQTIIGVYAHEQGAPRLLRLDVEMELESLREAAASDHLRDALDYAAVAEDITAFAHETRVQLLETFAERLARLLFERYPLLRLVLTVHKPGAVPNTQSLGIRIDRRRADYAVCGR